MDDVRERYRERLNTAADHGALGEELRARLLGRAGPEPADYEESRLDLVLEAYHGAAEPARHAYRDAFADFLDDLHLKADRGADPETVTLAAFALDFFEAEPDDARIPPRVRRFVDGFVFQLDLLRRLPAVGHGAPVGLFAPIQRLHLRLAAGHSGYATALTMLWCDDAECSPEAVESNGRLLVALAALGCGYVPAARFHTFFAQARRLAPERAQQLIQSTFAATGARLAPYNLLPLADDFEALAEERLADDRNGREREELRRFFQVVALVLRDPGLVRRVRGVLERQIETAAQRARVSSKPKSSALRLVSSA